MANYPLPGHAYHMQGSATTSVAEWKLPGQTTWLRIANHDDTNALEVFLTAKAAEAGAGNGITIATESAVEMPIQVGRFWTLAGGTVAFDVLAAIVP